MVTTNEPSCYPTQTAVSANARTIAGVALGSATLSMGLIAGLFYSFSCAVMPGLARADDRTFVEAMQQINVAIVNPVFLATFMGAFPLTIAAAALQRRLGKREATPWIMAASIFYGAVLLVTIGVNIPLNDQLAQAGTRDHIANLAAVRHQFEGPWVAWNLVRTVLSTAALGCLGRALALHGKASARLENYLR